MEDFGRVDDSSSPTVVSCLAMAAAAKNAKVYSNKNAKVYSNTKGSTAQASDSLPTGLFIQTRTDGVLVVSSIE